MVFNLISYNRDGQRKRQETGLNINVNIITVILDGQAGFDNIQVAKCPLIRQIRSAGQKKRIFLLVKGAVLKTANKVCRAQLVWEGEIGRQIY